MYRYVEYGEWIHKHRCALIYFWDTGEHNFFTECLSAFLLTPIKYIHIYCHHQLVFCSSIFACTEILVLFVANSFGRIQITRPRIQPVYIKTGDTLELICEQEDSYDLQWSHAPSHRPHLMDSDAYQTLESSSTTGFYMTSHKEGGRGLTQLTKQNMTVADSGSYKCCMARSPEHSYAVDVYVIQGKLLVCYYIAYTAFLTFGISAWSAFVLRPVIAKRNEEIAI